MSDVSFSIDAEHPALAGHFPGFPVVPAVVLIEHLNQALSSYCAQQSIEPLQVTALKKLKFLDMVKPGMTVTASFTIKNASKVLVKLIHQQNIVVQGSLLTEPLSTK